MEKFNYSGLINQLPFIVVLLILLALIMERCHREPHIEVITEIDTLVVVKRDTIRQTVTEFKWRTQVVYRDIPQEVDTLKILKDYFAIHFYEREIEEEHLRLWIRDSVSQNRIIFSEMDYEIYKDTVFVNIHEKETILRYRRGFYGHLDVSLNSLSPGISFMNNKGYQFGLGVHLYNIDGVRLSPHLRFSVPL